MTLGNEREIRFGLPMARFNRTNFLNYFPARRA
jgi:hypothetical protein